MTIEWLGIAAGVLTTGAFAPQALKILQARKVADISLAMYVCFVTGVALWIGYGLAIGSTALILSNLVTLLISGSVLAMKIVLGRA
jgi:MtN3 and saliva related transmembrane protein